MNKSQRQNFKAQAHHLNPVVMIGSKGLTEAVIDETNIALQAHELIKVKINGAEKSDRQDMATSLCSSLQAEFIQLIGNVAIIYRKKKDI